MTVRWGTRLIPWALVGLAIVFVVGEAVLNAQNVAATGSRLSVWDWLAQVLLALPPVTCTTMGAFVIARRPGNRIGWLMVLIGLSYGFSNFTWDYPYNGVVPPRPVRPLSPVVAWLQAWDFALYVIGLFLLVLLFPTGALPSRRWRPVLWIGLAAWVGVIVVSAVSRQPSDGTSAVNPYAFIAIPPMVDLAFGVCGFLAIAAGLVSVALRFRSTEGDVREQLKWFSYGASLAVTFVLAAFHTDWTNDLIAALALVSLAAFPVFIGVAILRYRLYDIDLLINRTLVYGSLTVSLAVIYLAAILAFQHLFQVGFRQNTELGVAISTLGIAALFQPLRRRIQVVIDRRFYRRKYDARQALGAFQSRLPNEVDLDELTGDLLGVVRDTVQPVHAVLWLRQKPGH